MSSCSRPWTPTRQSWHYFHLLLNTTVIGKILNIKKVVRSCLSVRPVLAALYLQKIIFIIWTLSGDAAERGDDLILTPRLIAARRTLDTAEGRRFPNFCWSKWISKYWFPKNDTDKYPNIFISTILYEWISEYISIKEMIRIKIRIYLRKLYHSIQIFNVVVVLMAGSGCSHVCTGTHFASRQYIWRENGQALKPKYTVHSVHPGSKSRLLERERERPLFRTVWKSKETGQTVCFWNLTIKAKG